MRTIRLAVRVQHEDRCDRCDPDGWCDDWSSAGNVTNEERAFAFQHASDLRSEGRPIRIVEHVVVYEFEPKGETE